ncbi:MAG: 50S ribosomal protein L6 [Anaerolineae bacterium]|nr:MAG: 50S ribosomal protein L6 [Anaerolineae bacterium]
MSRIGKMPIELPKGVKVDINGSDVTVSGSKGKLVQRFHNDMLVRKENSTLYVERPSDSRQHRSLHGLTRALLNNMVIGVSDGFKRKLEIVGVGYRAELKGKNLVLNVGYSHQVELLPPDNLTFEVEDRGKTIFVTGIDKQVVGEICAQIRKVRPPEPYKGKGIRFEGEYVRRKAGKAGKI